MPAEGSLRDGREADFHLIETMRSDPETGIVRLPLHLARLESSARELGFAFDRASVDAALAALPATESLQRIRLLLHPHGSVSAEAFPFAPMAEGTRWRLRLAALPLASSDALLRHKTSRRAVYEAARGEYTNEQADEVLLSNERGEVCEGTITTLFADLGDGVLSTPALECGLLAGVLRADLIAHGTARETILRPQDLSGAARLFVGNSLRELIPATLVTD